MLAYKNLKINYNRPYIWHKPKMGKNKKPMMAYKQIKEAEEDFNKYKKDVKEELERVFSKNIDDSKNINEMSSKVSEIIEYLGRSLIFDTDMDPQQLLKHTNKVTLEKKLQPWCKQLNMNVPYIREKGYGILGLLNKFKDVPAFVIAAGPSLKNNIAELRHVGNKGLIIAVDTSFRPLLDAGVEPPLVMAHDANHNGAKFFLPKDYFPPDTLNNLNDYGLSLALEALRNDKPNILKNWHYNTIGVFVNYISPLTIESFCGDMLAFYSVYDPGLPVYQTMCNAINWKIGKDGIFEPYDKGAVLGGSSVGHTAFYLAHSLGCNPISFVGLDLSYPGGKTYVEGASNQKDMSKIKLIDVEDISDKPVKSNISMFSYKVVLEKMLPNLIMQSNLSVYNATEHEDHSPAGILECGATPRRLDSIIDEYCKEEIENIKNLIKKDRDGKS